MFLQKYQIVAYEELRRVQVFCIKSPAALLGSVSLGDQPLGKPYHVSSQGCLAARQCHSSGGRHCPRLFVQ